MTMSGSKDDDGAKGGKCATARKSPSTYDTAPYEVGKGKPPKGHQFKQGNKGGPGRPKGSRNRALHNELLDERVKVGEDRLGRPIRKTYREIINRQLLNKAAKGETSAIKLVKDYELKHIELERKYGPPRRSDEDIAHDERIRIETKKTTEKLKNNFFDMLNLYASLKKLGIIEITEDRIDLVKNIREMVDDMLARDVKAG